MSPLHFIEAVLPGMVARRWGRIVNIATSRRSIRWSCVFSAARRGLRCELHRRGGAAGCPENVTLNNVLPGMFHTAAVHDQFTAAAQKNGTSYDVEVSKFVEAYQIPGATLWRAAGRRCAGGLAVQRVRWLHHRPEHRRRWRHDPLDVLGWRSRCRSHTPSGATGACRSA